MSRKTIKESDPPPPLTELIDVQECARRLCISRATVFRLKAEGQLPYIMLGERCLRFDPRAIARWIEQQKRG